MMRADSPLDFPAPDLDGPIVYLPVRHHSPACAFHVDKVIRALTPAAVLIEGPRDATHLIPHLVNRLTRPPVALYTTFIHRHAQAPPGHHGAYYPLADYSPEFLAIRAGAEIGAELRFIDLTFAEMVVAQEAARLDMEGRTTAPSLQDEAHLRRSRRLQAASKRVGARDTDDLWDCLFEHDFRTRDSAQFFHNVLSWCALARHDYTPEMLSAELHDVREQAMRAEIEDAAAKANGRPIVVVTGGFHTVALPGTAARRLAAIKLSRPGDTSVTLIRYGFEQLDRLNGYASGMPSPEFYQQLWDDRDFAELLVEIARELRARLTTPSTAEVAAAVEYVRRLALFRDHRTPTREDVLDGVRSAFVKGSVDIEGVAVLAVARKHLAGTRMGEVPADAGRPALVLDFERTAAATRVKLDVPHPHEVSLDLYRSRSARTRSRFFHRLRLLSIPFAEWLRGPDYVAGQDLDRIGEAWRYRWQPATEARLTEQSKYGATLEEAASSLLHEQFNEVERSGLSSNRAARLILESYRCGLHDEAPSLLRRLAQVVTVDPSFTSVVGACLDLDLLRLSREPLEAHNVPGLEELVTRAWERAAFLVASLGTSTDSEEGTVLDALCTWSMLTPSLPDRELAMTQRRDSLVSLTAAREGNEAVLGAGFGLLYGDGFLDGATLGRHLAGYLGGVDPVQGAQFLRGVLRAARSACWQESSVLDAVHETIAELPEDSFLEALPHLRLAFSDLTPRECDKVAAAAASRCGTVEHNPSRTTEFTLADAVFASRVDSLVSDILARDGWTTDD